MGLGLQIVTCLTANIAIVLIVVAVATDHWASRENSKRHTHEGLWTKCVNHKHKAKVICMTPYRGSAPAKLVATILLLAITAIVHMFTFVLSLYLIFNRKKYLNKTEKYLAFTLLVSLLVTLVAVIIYTTYYNGNYYKLNWSYALLWGAIICYFAALILQVIHIDKSGKEETRQNVKYTSRRYTGTAERKA